MGEAELSARKRHHDLACVQMTREHEVEKARGEPSREAREMAEEDAKVGLGIGEASSVGLSSHVGAGIHADELHAPAAEVELDRAVAEERHTVGEAELRLLEPLRERIPARHEVVVSEDDEAGCDDGEVVPKPTEPRAPRDEVTGEADEIRLPLRNPL